MPSLTISLSLKSRLRSSTRGDSYGVLGFNPSLVFDFKNNYFRKSATDSTFGASITHAATTNATMTDGYGPNLVTNGTFDSDLSGWETSHDTLGGEFDNGTVKLGHTVYNSWTRQVLSGLVVGNTYEVSFSVTNDTQGSGGGSYVGIWETNSDASYIERFTYTKGVVGSYTFTFTATSTVSQIRLTKGSNTGVTNFDNVSVREAPAIKWRPHNTLSYSEDLTNSPWVTQVSATVDANVAAAPDGSMTASRLTFGGPFSNLRQIIPAVTGVTATTKVWIKLESGNATLAFGISAAQFDTINVTSEWVKYSTTDTEVASNGKGFLLQDRNSSGFGSVLIWHPHSFRSDLGGMVNNPDASTGLESYVPTTTTPVYAPRRGHHIYNGSAWVNEGILHESEARTNLMTSSGDLTGTGWLNAGSGAAIGAVTTGSPFGTYQTLSGPASPYQFGKTITSGATYVGWAFVKYSAGNGWFVINNYDTGGSKRAWFDLQNGVVGIKNSSVITHGMVDYGDGWWLCWSSKVSGSTSGGLSYEAVESDGVLTKSTSDTILIAGTQYELGATPSSYIPTGSSTVTRAAETLTVPAANLPYDSTNMSIQIDGKMTYADTSNAFEVVPYWWRRGGTDFIHALVSTVGGRTGQMQFYQRQSPSGQDAIGSVITAYSPNTDVPFNISARHGSTFINGAHEGTLLTADTTPTILPDLSTIDLNLGYIFMGTIGEFRMWSDDLGDVGITEATLPSTEPSLSLTFDGSENSFIVLDWSE